MSYRVKEIFATIQGEGILAGVPAVFVRFAGCNLWSGRTETRDRDAERNKAACPRWCDTDFEKGEELEGLAVLLGVQLSARYAGMSKIPLVVLTGGEPMLQLDEELLLELTEGLPHTMLAIETNGTIPIPRTMERRLGWICVSPKQLPREVKQRHGHELKVPYPHSLVDPDAYADELTDFEQYVLTPRATVMHVGASILSRDHARQVAEYCMKRPRWRMSLQMHKHAGMP